MASKLPAWPIEPWILVPLLVGVGLYLRGWASLRRRHHARLTGWNALAFLGGAATILVALGSPIGDLAHRLLLVHMIQHLLLMMVAPPLIWLGAPLAPSLRGLPGPLGIVVARILSAQIVRRLGSIVGHPITTWSAFVASLWAWHTPALYELALRSHLWHHLEHASLFGVGLLVWWTVSQPWPSRPVWPRWAMIPYLALADLQNTALAAILTFADRVLYPTYGAMPRLWGISALEDQATAGVIMWVPGSIAFLLPLSWLVARQLAPRHAHRPAVPRHGLRPQP
jgi:cytochrome c oxidase assembly factor CtaG